MQTTKKDILIKKAEALVVAKYTLSELSLKIINMVIAMIRPHDTEFQKYVIKVKEWKELSGLSGRSIYKNLLESAKELMSKPIYIKKEDGFLVLNWVASYRYIKNRGEIEIRIAPELKPYLLQLKEKFLQYDIKNIIKLKSAYVIRLYEFLKHQYKKAILYSEKQKEVVCQVSIEELREMFKIPKSYQYSSGIKLRIIDSAQKQFIKETDISFTYKEIKKGRMVDKIEFVITKNEKK